MQICPLHTSLYKPVVSSVKETLSPSHLWFLQESSRSFYKNCSNVECVEQIWLIVVSVI